MATRICSFGPNGHVGGIAARRLLVPLLLGVTAAAQSPCYDFGSTPTPATITDAPFSLGCAGAPTWPAWQLFLPWHREPGPHAGFNPGNAHALPAVLVTYHCTGFLLLPVLPSRVRLMGYVTDQPEHACG